jgi:hypothetical protein
MTFVDNQKPLNDIINDLKYRESKICKTPSDKYNFIKKKSGSITWLVKTIEEVEAIYNDDNLTGDIHILYTNHIRDLFTHFYHYQQ